MICKKSVRIMLIFSLIILILFTCVRSLPKMGTVLFYPICRELQKEILVTDKKDFNKIEGRNYQVFYKNQDFSYAKEASSSVEKNLEYIIKDFGFTPAHKVDIIIYHDYNEMVQKMKLGNGITAIGAYYIGTISILNNYEIKNKNIDYDSVMLHELTHYVLDYMCGGNIPVWFTEGIALYEEYKLYNHNWPVRKNNAYYDYKQLQNYFYDIDEISAYNQSFLLINYIINNFGMKSIKDIAMELSSGKSIEQSVKKVLNITIDEMFRRYRSNNNI